MPNTERGGVAHKKKTPTKHALGQIHGISNSILRKDVAGKKIRKAKGVHILDFIVLIAQLKRSCQNISMFIIFFQCVYVPNWCRFVDNANGVYINQHQSTGRCRLLERSPPRAYCPLWKWIKRTRFFFCTVIPNSFQLTVRNYHVAGCNIFLY